MYSTDYTNIFSRYLHITVIIITFIFCLIGIHFWNLVQAELGILEVTAAGLYRLNTLLVAQPCQSIDKNTKH